MKGGGGIPLIAASATWSLRIVIQPLGGYPIRQKVGCRVFHHPLYAGAQTPPRNAPAVYIAFYASHPERNRTMESKGLVTFLRHLLLT